MSRSGYVEDCDMDALDYGRWRGAVQSALTGKRGQSFLIELRDALDAMPVKELITDNLEHHGQFCTLGVVGNARGMGMDGIDINDPQQVAAKFGIAWSMAAEIVFMNDEATNDASPANRWKRMREWVDQQIRKDR